MGFAAYLPSVYNEYKKIFPGVKQPEREPSHSAPSTAELKNEGGQTPLFPVFVA
jgi:hypothetical protein